jgi:hypothetical protein
MGEPILTSSRSRNSVVSEASDSARGDSDEATGQCNASGPVAFLMLGLTKDTTRSQFSPVDTPFEDGTLKLVLTFDESYPNEPATVVEYAKGELCFNDLQNRW